MLQDLIRCIVRKKGPTGMAAQLQARVAENTRAVEVQVLQSTRLHYSIESLAQSVLHRLNGVKHEDTKT